MSYRCLSVFRFRLPQCSLKLVLALRTYLERDVQGFQVGLGAVDFRFHWFFQSSARVVALADLWQGMLL